MTPKVLVVDDDAGVRFTLREVLDALDVAVTECVDGQEALERTTTERFDLVLTDLQMPRVDGMTLLARLRERPDAPPVVMITAHGSERHAVEAMKRGAVDYFAKPFDIDQVTRVVERCLAAARMREENESLRAELALARHMVFASEAMRRVALLVARVAPRDVTVHLSGPSGTGKERVAEALVAASPRARRSFVRVNCGALPRELADAELFGHARGAFTGAVRARPGLFREADGGTLLLDEVGELDPLVQTRLLRALQEGVVRPVGEDRDVRVDVRVLTATHRDLRRDVAAGRFREDLFYRLNVVEIRLPPLAERREDIPVLIEHFARKFGERFGAAPVRVPDALRDALTRAPLPGNVRELEHTIERLVALSPPGALDLSLLDDVDVGSARGAAPLGLKEQVDAFERGVLVEALRRCEGNRSEAARQLGVARVTLLDKLKRHGIDGDGG